MRLRIVALRNMCAFTKNYINVKNCAKMISGTD